MTRVALIRARDAAQAFAREADNLLCEYAPDEVLAPSACFDVARLSTEAARLLCDARCSR